MRAAEKVDGTRFKLLVLNLRQAETDLEHAKDFGRYVVVRDRAVVLGTRSFIPTSHVNMSSFSAESAALLKLDRMLIAATDFVGLRGSQRRACPPRPHDGDDAEVSRGVGTCLPARCCPAQHAGLGSRVYEGLSS